MGHIKSASSESTQRNQHEDSSRNSFNSPPESCQVFLQLVWQNAHATSFATEGILLFGEEEILSAYGIVKESLVVLPHSSKQISLKYLPSQSLYFLHIFLGTCKTVRPTFSCENLPEHCSPKLWHLFQTPMAQVPRKLCIDLTFIRIQHGCVVLGRQTCVCDSWFPHLSF